MKFHVFVYSADHFFIESFGAYIMENSGNEFDVSLYTEKAAAETALKSQSADAVLADQDFLVRNQESLQNSAKIAIAEQTGFQTHDGIYELNIYQRGKDILSDLKKIVTGDTGKRVVSGEKAQKVIAFYSPQGGTGKTTLAYICALLGARNKTSIYLNLEEFGYTDHLYKMSFGVSMEEIMFQVKDNRDVNALLSEAICRDNRNVSVLPVMQNIKDYMDVTADNVLKMLEKLKEVSEAEYIFVDLSGGLSGRNSAIMEQSDAVFLVFTDNAVGRGKMERIKNDRSIQGDEVYRHMFFVMNQCRTKEGSTDVIRIPYSNTLSADGDLEQALSGNRELYQSCMEIMSIVEGQ